MKKLSSLLIICSVILTPLAYADYTDDFDKRELYCLKVEEFAIEVLSKRYDGEASYTELMKLAGDDEVKQDVVNRSFGVPYWTTEWRIKEELVKFSDDMFKKCLIPFSYERDE